MKRILFSVFTPYIVTIRSKYTEVFTPYIVTFKLIKNICLIGSFMSRFPKTRLVKNGWMQYNIQPCWIIWHLYWKTPWMVGKVPTALRNKSQSSSKKPLVFSIYSNPTLLHAVSNTLLNTKDNHGVSLGLFFLWISEHTIYKWETRKRVFQLIWDPCEIFPF